MTSSSNSSQALVLQDQCFGKNYSSFLDFIVIASGQVEVLSPAVEAYHTC